MKRGQMKFQKNNTELKIRIILISIMVLLAMVNTYTISKLLDIEEKQMAIENKVSLDIESIILPNVNEMIKQMLETEQSLNNIKREEVVKTEEPKVIEKTHPQVELFVVNVDALNIREGASTEYAKVGTYYKGQIIEVIAKENEWLKTKDGNIHSDYVITMEQHNETLQRRKTIVSRGGSYHRQSYITMSSGLTVDDIAILIKGTGFEGTEQAIYDVEHKNGINAFYTIGIAKLESANGKSNLANTKNNLFGAAGKNGYIEYSSKSESIYHFGEFMQNLYINKGLITLEEINPKYCPPNPEWKVDVIRIVQSDMKKLSKS